MGRCVKMLVTEKVDVGFPVEVLEAVDRLVNDGVYLSRSSVIRQALRDLFREQGIKPFYPRVNT